MKIEEDEENLKDIFGKFINQKKDMDDLQFYNALCDLINENIEKIEYKEPDMITKIGELRSKLNKKISMDFSKFMEYFTNNFNILYSQFKDNENMQNFILEEKRKILNTFYNNNKEIMKVSLKENIEDKLEIQK